MGHIIKKTSITNDQKLNDLLSQTEKIEDCLIWTRCFNTDGYPRMGGNVKVHRLVYELTTNEDIHGYVIRHSCDNPKCINPKHLLRGFPRDNVKDMDERERRYKKITKEIVYRVKELIKTDKLSFKEIALLVGIDPRRVSDINTQRYNDEAQLTRR